MVTVLLATLAVTQAPKLWVPRLARAVLLLLAFGGFAKVSWGIVMDKPGMLAPVYVLFYLVLLYALFLGLRIGLEPSGATDTT